MISCEQRNRIAEEVADAIAAYLHEREVAADVWNSCFLASSVRAEQGLPILSDEIRALLDFAAVCPPWQTVPDPQKLSV